MSTKSNKCHLATSPPKQVSQLWHRRPGSCHISLSCDILGTMYTVHFNSLYKKCNDKCLNLSTFGYSMNKIKNGKSNSVVIFRANTLCYTTHYELDQNSIPNSLFYASVGSRQMAKQVAVVVFV